MIAALVLGELIADPVQRQTAKGGSFVTATIRTGAGGESVLIGISTFSESAAAKLAQLRKGDSLAATGVLEQNVWTDRDGNERRGWRLTASQVLTAYEAGKRRQKASEGSGDAVGRTNGRSSPGRDSGGPDGLPAGADSWDFDGADR